MLDLKTIQYRGGLVTFQIPSTWHEEYERDGGGTFFPENPNSGTLRLNVLTLALKTDVNKESLAKVLKGRAPNQSFIMRPDETAITRYLKTAVEGEEELSLHYWEIASLQPPQNVRLAVFSFTVLTRLASTVETANELSLIDDCISKAVISRASSSKAPTQKNHWWKVW